jgi:hypothetical protein
MLKFRRANPGGKRLGPIVGVLDAAVGQLTAEMMPGVRAGAGRR